MMDLYNIVSEKTSKMTTKLYSTSFSLGIMTLHKSVRQPIYNIYGFVRFADEIVDTFTEQNQRAMLDEFRQQTIDAIENKLSTNPILHAFQLTVNQYHIPWEYIETFLSSMCMDLEDQNYNQELYDHYIDGSAEVVGLMCLCVFCDGNIDCFESLELSARRLGAVFQKVNFLRDMQYDYKVLHRTYFPNLDFNQITAQDFQDIFDDIETDFDVGLKGIKQLPNNSKFGVYLAYKYYRKLFTKIKKTPLNRLKTERIRIPNAQKYLILGQSVLAHIFKIY